MTIHDLPGDNEASHDVGTVGAFPSTLSQMRVWAKSKDPDCRRAYNVAMRWLVQGSLSHASVESALNVLVQRHEILRTSFREIDGNVRQVVWPEIRLKVQEIDLTFLGEDERHGRAEEIAESEAREPFDLSGAPPLRATFVRFGDNMSILLLTTHSIAIDGWSIGLLIREFRIVAAAIEAGNTMTMPTPELQFVDYALWEREMLASGALDDSRAFWRRRLRDAAGTEVAPDRPHGDQATGRSDVASVLLSIEFGREIEAFARQQGVTLYGLGAAALAATLHCATGDAEIVIGSQVANREDPAAESIIGPIVNSITLRMPVDPAVSLRSFLMSAWNAVQESVEHQRLPFEAVSPSNAEVPRLHAINLVVQRAYSDISQVEESDLCSFTMQALPSLPCGALWDFNFFMVGRREGWRMSCEANTDLYDRATIELMLNAWRENLERLIAAPESCLTDCLPLRNRTRAPQKKGPWCGRAGTNDAPLVVDDPSRQILQLNSEGSRTPIIALNTGDIYFRLAERMGADRPFIDIQLNHPDGPFELPKRAFEDFAADAVRIIRIAQRKGPYILCGNCVKGVLAFEAARQLQRLGEEVALVAVFDSWAPGYRETMPIHDKWRRWTQLRLNDVSARSRHIAARVQQYLSGNIGADELVWQPFLRRLGYAPAPAVETHPAHWYEARLAEARSDYRSKPFDGDLIVFRSKSALRGHLFDAQMGWGGLVTGRLTSVDVASEHHEMFREEGASIIAGQLQTTLSRIEGRLIPEVVD